MKNHKKAEGLTLETIIIAALVLVVLIVVVIFFSRTFGGEADNTRDNIKCINTDTDNDGVNDFMDKCCKGSTSDVDARGCSPGQKEDRTCC